MKKIVLLIALIVTQVTFSQDYKFGKVSKAELEETTHSKDADANAAVLYRSQDISFKYEQGKGFIQNNKIHERIKIYNKEGYDYATKTIRLYNESSDTKDKLIDFKAYTYNLENGKIEDAKLKKDGIFEEKTNKYWKKVKFTMPNINDGCVIEYTYTVQSQLIGIDDVPFQKMIPINKLDFKVATPEYYKYKALLNPKATYLPQLNQSTEQSEFTVSSSSRTTPSSYNQNSNTKTTFDKSTVDYISDVITANLTAIPALKDEVFVDNLSNYQAKLIMELRSIVYPNKPVKSFSRNWEDVTKSIYDSDNFGQQLEKTNYFKKDLETVLNGKTTPEEQITAIFNHVKSKVKWNEFIGCYTDLGVSKAYKEGSGNVADINLMLIAMLRHSGLQANPVLVSTRSNGIPITATKDGFNYVIAAVEFPEGIVLLDASSAYSSPNVLPKHILNWQGRMVRERGSSTWVSLKPKVNSKQVTFLNATINDDLSVVGKVREQLTNHLAMSHRKKYNGLNEEEHIRTIEDGKGDIEIANVDVKAKKELSKPILLSYEYALENGLEEIGGKLYFSPMLFLAPEENLFKQDTRQYPIDFVHPISDKYVINIKIPEGYLVESLPENAKIQFNVNDGEFGYLAKHTNDLIQLTITLDLNRTIILPKDYPEFKKFFDLAIKKQTEQIVLKKA